MQLLVGWCCFYEDLYGAFGGGMGLLNSRGTGLPYLGAGWVRDPLPAVKDLQPLHYAGILFYEGFVLRLFPFLIFPQTAAWHMAIASEWGFLFGYGLAYSPLRKLALLKFTETFGVIAVFQLEREATASKRRVSDQAKASIQEKAEAAARAAKAAGTDMETAAPKPALVEVKTKTKKGREIHYPESFSCREYFRWFFVERSCSGDESGHSWVWLFGMWPLFVFISLLTTEIPMVYALMVTWDREELDERSLYKWFSMTHLLMRMGMFCAVLMILRSITLQQQVQQGEAEMQFKLSGGKPPTLALTRQRRILRFLVIFWTTGIYCTWLFMCGAPARNRV